MNERELILIVALAQFGLHYFPWRKVLGGELPRLAAYTLGLLGMMAPLSVWLMDCGQYEILQTLWFVIGVAGLTVFATYGVDHLINRGDDAKEHEAILRDVLADVERLLRERIHAKANDKG